MSDAAPTATDAPSNGALGMWLFLVSDAATIFAMLTALVGLRLRGADFHAAAEPVPSAMLALGLTALLMWSGAHAASALRGHAPRVHFALAALLGIAFLFGQAHEWHGLMAQHFTLGSSHFASLFYAATGFHGLHVAIGVLLLLGAVVSPQPGTVRTVALYWLFVDLIWSFLFVAFYLV